MKPGTTYKQLESFFTTHMRSQLQQNFDLSAMVNAVIEIIHKADPELNFVDDELAGYLFTNLNSYYVSATKNVTEAIAFLDFFWDRQPMAVLYMAASTVIKWRSDFLAKKDHPDFPSLLMETLRSDLGGLTGELFASTEELLKDVQADKCETMEALEGYQYVHAN